MRLSRRSRGKTLYKPAVSKQYTQPMRQSAANYSSLPGTEGALGKFQPVSFARSISIDSLAGIDVEIGRLVHVEGEFHLLPRLHRGFCLQTRRHFFA